MSQRRFVWEIVRYFSAQRFPPFLHTHVIIGEHTGQGETLQLLDLVRGLRRSQTIDRLELSSCMAAAGSAQDYLRLLHFELDPASWHKRVAP